MMNRGMMPVQRDFRRVLAVACGVILLVAVVRMGRVAVADDRPPARPAAGGEDPAGKLDRAVERLERLLGRIEGRVGPDGPHGADRPPEGRPRHGEPHGRERLRPDERIPGDAMRPDRGWEGRGRPEVPPEIRGMMEQRMREGREHMEQARERFRELEDRAKDKFRELEDRVKSLEAEVSRLKAER